MNDFVYPYAKLFLYSMGVQCNSIMLSLTAMVGSRNPPQDITWDDRTKHGNEEQAHGDRQYVG